MSAAVAQAEDNLARGYEALASGDWLDAREAFASAVTVADSPAALDGLGRALWWLREERDAVVYRERAYAGFAETASLPERRGLPSGFLGSTHLRSETTRRRAAGCRGQSGCFGT